MAALGSAAQVISSLSQDTSRQYTTAAQELSALQIGVGPGITSDYGIKSILTQRAEAERLVGISGLIDAIKDTPTLDPAAAQAAWVASVAATITTTPLEDPVGIVSAIMVIAGCADWNAFLSMVAAGNKADLMAAVS
jgi:hypothetical protein